MSFEKTVIACGGLEPELEAFEPRKDGVEVLYLDQNLHRTPDKMTAAIQEAIDGVSESAKTIVLGYGLCSNGIVGLVAPKQGLIIPRVHDCIAIFLGSHDAYRKAFGECAGSYYLTPGWIAEEKDPLGMLKEYTKRVGEEEAVWAIGEEMKHYKKIVLIETIASKGDDLVKRAKENARFLDLDLTKVKGEKRFFGKILFGPYDDKNFVHIEPFDTVKQKPFLI